MIAIYKITNVKNGKFYVGSTVDTRVRFQTHRRQLRKGTHHCAPLQAAWSKYGEECFKFSVAENVNSKDDLFEAENRWLSEHHGKIYCYNISRFADAPMRGVKFSDEHSAKISVAMKGNQFAKGYKRTPEECEAIRLRKIGNTNFLGKTHSEEARARLSAAHQGKQHRLGHQNSPEHRARISAAMKGKAKSPEHVEKIRQRMIGTSYAKGRIVTEEQRAKMSRPVREMTSGTTFASIREAAEFYGLGRPNVIRAIRNDEPLKRGPRKGLHFRLI